jgi:hydrogenase maturation protein HypF
VAFDGTGYGDDGAIWGGEFLVATYNDYERPLHLTYVPLPGGDLAVKQPWRLALAWLHQTGLGWEADLPPLAYAQAHLDNSERQLDVLRHQLENGVNAPPTSSMGRLFDAAAALAGVRQTVNYEAQAAIEFEALADPEESGVYEFIIQDGEADPTPMFQALAADVRAGIPLPIMSARFHNGVAQMTLQACQKLRSEYGLNKIALSGGVWQNMRLLANTVKLLKADRFQVYLHCKIPANDGGLALGQAAVAVRKLQDA